jgi:predicted AlkP superfamily pyrophosphatase or phosphodiesterase
MKRLLTLLLFVPLFSSFAQQEASNERPKLVVGIVVDQMRQEYLHRFYPHFEEGGFKRFVEQGFMAKNGHYDYIPTFTGPGHASVYTGTSPATHGVIANDFYSPELRRMVYCAEDTSVVNLGGTERNGQISPRNLLSTTIGDELKLFSNKRSKVIGISIKDRGAALPAGFLADGAYWYDTSVGEMMSSTWYFDTLPQWVNDFNARKLPDELMAKGWETLLPIESYIESQKDDRPYERAFAGKTTFPYDFKAMQEAGGSIYGMLPTTPHGNTLVLEMAKAAIEAENLGNGSFTDLLAISFSSPDYIGHAFGAYSKEIQDAYIRLDRELQAFFSYLDEKVGSGEYTVFLTADHAVANVPQHNIANRLPGGYYSTSGIRSILRERVNARYLEDFILNVSNEQVFLDENKIRQKGLEVREVEEFIADQLMGLPDIVGAYTSGQIRQGLGVGRQFTLLTRGFHPRRSGNVLYHFRPNFTDGGYGKVGTTHGAGWNYDTHVPILFYGWGVPEGKSSVERLHITDIAPTLSMLLKISLPTGADGSPIKAIFEE